MDGKSATKGRNFPEIIKTIFTSPAYPFITAAVMLLCYYTALDILAIYYLAISAILMFMFLDDLTPVLNIFLFMSVCISFKNSPSHTAGNSNYFFQPAILAQVIALIAILIIALIYRIVKTCVDKRFKPTAVFYSLCGLSGAFILNGLFTENYTIGNLLYGVLLCALYLGIFVFIKDNLKLNKNSFKYIALCFFALSILLVIELFLRYITIGDLYINGELNRNLLSFGWGVYNTMGMLLLLCIPPVIYLATQYKYGYLFYIYSFLLAVCCFLSMSRQAMLGAIIIYPICLFMLFTQPLNRKIHIIITAFAVAVACVFVGIYWKPLCSALYDIFSNVVTDDGKLNGSGRMDLYIKALNDFRKSPLFGEGFFCPSLSDLGESVSGLGIDIHFYHNTVLQMMGSCGIVGLICYTVHRVITIMCLCNNITVQRGFIGATILVIILLSLVDIHMFDVLPTFTYSFLLAVLVASESEKVARKKPVTILVG